MSTAAAFVVWFACQESPDRLRDAWPKLIEAWRAMEACREEESPLDDPMIRALRSVSSAFEVAGFLNADLEFESAALKQLFAARYRIKVGKVVRPAKEDEEDGITLVLTEKPSGEGGASSYGFDTLLSAVENLHDLRAKKLDHEDNVAEEVAILRKSLRAFQLLADDTPVWLGRRLVSLVRALLIGDPYPEPAKATDEQIQAVRKQIEELGSSDLDVRETATQTLLKVGEIARPYLRHALQSKDSEVVSRVQLILGVGHAPWRENGK